ncbi:DUF1715 family protein [Schizosaccharomyces japonicus yFS275]|uniref:DUF1715 family protein n=1 Tax=Schizosaccharomyces japonicus (strain yFS275 / FY16936) TaxID=402676 RepID=B6K123_SCHJY|nr:DUF1715 family protein [Schizosaccharomyces japonicus yFS275]EEB07644.1 DUF1715 family protein [Schizosaccharomyces japonicus yFS275]
MVFDEVLEMEESIYREGYEEGLKNGEKEGRQEALLFGLEHAYNRFLLLGEIQGRCTVWLAHADEHPKLRKAKRHLEQLDQLLQKVPFHNETKDVEHSFDTFWNKIEAKCRLLSSVLGTKILPTKPVDKLDGFE